MSEANQGIWACLTGLRAAALVAMKHKAAWNLKHLFPVPGMPRGHVDVGPRAEYIEWESCKELGC